MQLFGWYPILHKNLGGKTQNLYPVSIIYLHLYVSSSPNLRGRLKDGTSDQRNGSLGRHLKKNRLQGCQVAVKAHNDKQLFFYISPLEGNIQ